MNDAPGAPAPPNPAPPNPAPPNPAPPAAPPAQVPFLETLEHGLSGHSALQKFQDANQLAQGYIELSQKLGQQGALRQEVPAQFTPEAYYVAGEKIPAFYREIAEYAHGAGVPPERFRQFAEKVWETQAKQRQSRQRQNAMQRDVRSQEAKAQLQKHWGRNYNANMKAAEWAAHRMGLAEPLQKAGLNRDPRVMVALARMGHHLAEDRTLGVRGGRRAFGGGPTRQDLGRQADKLTADAYQPGVSAPKRQEMLDQAMRLRQQAYG